MRTSYTRLSVSASVFAIAVAGAVPAFAQTDPAAPPAAPPPEACAGITDDAQRQACVTASENRDPLASQGEADTLPIEGPPASADGTQAPAGNAIVITGSRLRRDERSSSDPLTVIDPNQEGREGNFTAAQILQTSPLALGSTQLTSIISSATVQNGGEGVETIGLRGLGANRTLVLLNGRRAGPAGTRGGVSAFDLNVLPVEAIQAIDILKTGASSIYGSDAIAGVVNIITKKDLRGLNLSGFTSIPSRAGGEEYSVAATWGTALGDRGHLMFGVDYYRRNELERGDRSYLGCEEEYVFNEAGERSDPRDPRTGEFYCGNFLNNLVSVAPVLMAGNNLVGPCVPAIPGTSGGNCGPNFTRRPIGYVQFNGPGDRLDEFLSGILQPPANPTQFEAPDGFFPTGFFNSDSYGLTDLYDPRVDDDSVIPTTKRLTFFAEGGYDITDTVSLYFEGLYNNRKTKTDGSRQLFFNQFPGVATNVYTEDYGIYLPYFFCDGSTCDPFAQGDPLNAGFNGAVLLTPIVYAPSDSSTNVNYYRGVIGARADIDSIIKGGFADAYFQHSRSDGDYKRDIIFRDAIEFGVAELRTDLCEGTVTAIRGVPCIDIDYTDPRILRGDFTPEERAFLFGEDEGNTVYKQSTFEASFGGNLFNLPGGTAKFALGGQWRRDSINDVPGEVTRTGNSWASTAAGITAGYQRTLEGFGELELPLLKDIPGIEELTLNGAARITSTYAKSRTGESDSDKGNWTYKVAANWRPFSPIRLRATYGTSFRSPALFEQFLADETSFFSDFGIDPCINWGQSENATVRANCAAVGIPDNFTGASSSFIAFSSGGIGVLDPETSKALTLSAIFTPDRWLWSGGQFSFAVDYIHIKVKDQVTQLGPAAILAGCYGSENFDTEVLCSFITRDTDPNSPDQFAVTELLDPYLNIDTQDNKSIDFTMRFRQDLGAYGSLSLLGQATYQLKDKFELFAGDVADFNGEAGDPKWVGDLTVTWVKNPFTVTYGLNYIQGTNDLENLEIVGGAQLNENNCLAVGSGYAVRGGPYCPRYKMPEVFYHSLSGQVKLAKNFTLTAGVANLFDKKPPLVSTVGAPITPLYQTAFLGSYYDYIGRRFFVSVRTNLESLGLGF